MDNISDLLCERSVPGVLIIDADCRLLYVNQEALGIIPAIQSCTLGEPERLAMPEEIISLCDRLKAGDPSSQLITGSAPACQIVNVTTGNPLCARAFFIGSMAGDESRHIMVLMERFLEKHEVDFSKAKNAYHLSKRQVEVLQGLCRGLTNREIAGMLFICEYTVKDHLKKIMKNMGVKSRSEILFVLRR